jgi:small-conductance mechanosensitive channel
MSPGELQNLIQFVALDRLPFALLVIAIGWALLAASTRVLDDLGERFTERRLLFKQARALTRFSLYLLVPAIVASSVLRLEPQVLLAVAGSISVAVGFAFKDLLGSLIAGVILLVDRPFVVGDRIRFGSWYGEVVEMGLRAVRIVTLDDTLVTIPNGKFLTDEVGSANAGNLHAQVVIPFFVASAEDFERARRIVVEATATSRYAYLGKPLLVTVEDKFLGERFVTQVTSRAYVFDVRYELEYATDVTERVKRAFRDARIRTPDLAYRDLALFGREVPRRLG